MAHTHRAVHVRVAAGVCVGARRLGHQPRATLMIEPVEVRLSIYVHSTKEK